MINHSRIVAAAIVLVGLTAIVDPAQASCSSTDNLFTTFNDKGNSIIRTPTFPDDIGDTVSDKAFGCFWSFGHGNPTLTVGHDAGSLCALATGDADTWWKVAPATASYIGPGTSNWTVDGTDGCIRDNLPDPQCMVVLLADDPSTGTGYFALLSDEPDGRGYFELNSTVARNETILLRAVPPPAIPVWSRTSSTETSVTVVVHEGYVPGDGIYNNCPYSLSQLVTGYRIYSQQVAHQGAAPTNRNTSFWTPLAPDPLDPNDPPLDPNDPVAFGPRTYSVTCSGDQDVYLCATLTFESGFETRYCSANAVPVSSPSIIRCGACASDMDCDDGDTCTTDSCDTGTGECSYTFPACGGPQDTCCGPSCNSGTDVDCPPGAVPDGGGVPGTMLTVGKAPGSENILLSWGASCLAGGIDYAIYEGTVAAPFTSHVQKVCSTTGLTTATIAPASVANYYLVVAQSPEDREGSYGTRTSGPRPAATSPCLVTQDLAACSP